MRVHDSKPEPGLVLCITVQAPSLNWISGRLYPGFFSAIHAITRLAIEACSASKEPAPSRWVFNGR